MSGPDGPGTAVLSEWLRYHTVSEWHQGVRAPGEVLRAVILVMDRLSVPFQTALMFVVAQGTVIPVSSESAIADLARFNELLTSLPPSASDDEPRSET